MTNKSIQLLLAALKDTNTIKENPFDIARAIGLVCNRDPASKDARELVIRALDHQELFQSTLPGVLESLAQLVGLFPYIQEPERLGTRERLTFEAHKPFSLILNGREIVFHKDQAIVYQALMDGYSLVLSAPTSFGKSLIIDALIASGRFNNIVIVVPTIALIDETRRRLSRFRATHKIITHQDQAVTERNVFVLTQERVIDRDDIEDIDLSVIDEFYKLDSPSNDDGERASILNDALHKLRKKSRQIYLLGPNINQIPEGFGARYQCQFIKTEYNTVISEIHRQSFMQGRDSAFLSLCKSLQDPTMIYCRAPNQANKVLKILVESINIKDCDELNSISDWVADTYHKKWVLVQALRRGIGVHHGRMPRSLAQQMISLFDNHHLDFLVCTSSLIEGVNTTAKNVILYEGRINQSELDSFTFRNIQGRAGRMFRHFIGNVYIFDPPPEPQLDYVDIPVYSQDDDSPLGLLVQLDEEDLSEKSKVRVNEVYKQNLLSPETIRGNKHVDPWKQVNLAKELTKDAQKLHPMLAWTGMPTYDQLKLTCSLAVEYFVSKKTKTVKSGNQLAFRLQQLKRSGSAKNLISLFENDDLLRLEPDDAVEAAMDFQRTWASFKVPRILGAVDLIQRDVFEKLGLFPGDYSAYISRVESLFMPKEIVALDEYGLPVELGRKIQQKLVLEKGLDAAIESVRALDPLQFAISDFERKMIKDCQQCL